jgi:glycosyltransferase involved in cell wall biosynthesis
MPRSTLSVAIITLNEEANLARTLSSVQFADEVVVVDSGSTDRTLEVAKSFGAKTFTEPWKGFARQKNYEELTVELQKEIGRMLEADSQDGTQINGYRLRLRHVFLGRWMRHGGYYPDLKLRLFRRSTDSGAACFTDRPVHESVQIAGGVETMKNDFLHHGYPDLNIYLEHMNRYSSLGGQIVAAKGKVSRSWVAFCWNVALVPMLTFVWNFGFRLGFIDGREGLLLHLYHSAYISWKYAKAWQTGSSGNTQT